MSEKIIDVEVIKSTEDIDPKYSQYYSENAFWEKIKNVLVALGLKKIAYYACELYYVFPKIPLHMKAIIFAALGYLIFPVDLIPDFIPVIGYSDDLMALTAAVAEVSFYIDDEVKQQAKVKIDELFGPGASNDLE